MPRYRKKPVEISAVQLRWDTWGQVCEEILDKSQCIAYGVYVTADNKASREPVGNDTRERIGLQIETLEGPMLGIEGDYIILGVQNEIYPCKPSIFEATYEAVDA